MRTIPFIKYRFHFALLSIIAVVGSIYLVLQKGLNFDTDFKGGTKLLYSFVQPIDEAKLRDILKGSLAEGFTVRQFGEPKENRFLIRTELAEAKAVGLGEQVTKILTEALGSDQITLQQEEEVGPKAGKELQHKAQLAVIVSCLLILIYIGFRFDFMFAPGAIVALVHDIIVTIGAMALTQRSFSLTSVAALLTILGYSINDTIVLYDRIRENKQKAVSESEAEIIDTSINQVLSRTIITSLTVLFVVVILFFVAEGDIKDFAFAMIVGAVAGTYSTVFVASPVYLLVRRWWPRITPLFAGKKR